MSLLTGDTACSSAAHSLHDALADITAGRTDYAIVLGSCHILAANMTLAFNRLHMLSPEGACKAFDAAGNGCVTSTKSCICIRICLTITEFSHTAVCCQSSSCAVQAGAVVCICMIVTDPATQLSAVTQACALCRYVRSEGILAIVLKRSDLETTPMWAAVSPYATILNCGLNNDGALHAVLSQLLAG